MESDMRKTEGKMEGREKPVDLEGPSGLTMGPSLIGRPVRAWMTTKWD